MMTAEDCRRKATEHLQASQEASDPYTSQSLRRLSDAWATLAGQIEKDPHTVRQRKLKQSRQTEPHKANIDTAQVADILRERLQLGGFSMDEPPDSTSRSRPFLLIDSQLQAPASFITGEQIRYEKWIKEETRLDDRPRS